MAEDPTATRRLRVVTDGSHPPAGPDPDLTEATMDELVQDAVAGGRRAFDEIVRRTHRHALGLALRLTSDPEDARDVVQDAYLRAYRGLDRFRGESKFSTWLYRIVANCASTSTGKRRRHRHEQLPDEAYLVDHGADQDPALHGDVVDLRAELDAAIRDLPPRLRSVVVLRDVYDLPHDAIARELGISTSAAKVRLHRARHRLRERVYPLPGEELRAI